MPCAALGTRQGGRGWSASRPWRKVSEGIYCRPWVGFPLNSHRLGLRERQGNLVTVLTRRSEPGTRRPPPPAKSEGPGFAKEAAVGGQGPARGPGDLRVGVLEKRNTALFHPDASTVRPGLVPPALKHKLFRNFPGELASSEMAVACRLLVDGLLQIQVPVCSAEKRSFLMEKEQSFFL